MRKLTIILLFGSFGLMAQPNDPGGDPDTQPSIMVATPTVILYLKWQWNKFLNFEFIHIPKYAIKPKRK